jgi:predicted phage terminase large subunit-like protein
VGAPHVASLTPAGLARYESRGKWTLAPHLDILNRKLVDVIAGRCKRLIVTMPPRHGKSMLTSQYFPASYIGNRPDDRVLHASYEAKFSESWGRKARDVLKAVGGEVFGLRVRRDSNAANHWNIEGRLGGMQTAGAGGAVTGKGADLFIIDDPVKNQEEALSPTQRAKIWDWYVTTAYTRLEPGGRIVIIMTRWHEDDLVGRVLKHAEENGERDEWEVVDFPAIADGPDELGRKKGDALWPERYSVEDLGNIKRLLTSEYSPLWWWALYQQKPRNPKGGLFNVDSFRSYRLVADGKAIEYGLGKAKRTIAVANLRRFLIMDPAFSVKQTADFTALGAWGVLPGADRHLFLLDMINERVDLYAPLVRRLWDRWSPAVMGIETVAAQLEVVRGLRREGFPVRELTPDKDKLSRALPAAAKADAGQIWIPAHAPWRSEWLDQHLAFPAGTHDDMVDVTSYAVGAVATMGLIGRKPPGSDIRTHSGLELGGMTVRRPPQLGRTQR